MTISFRSILDEHGVVIDLEVNRPGSSPLRMLDQGGPARELTVLRAVIDLLNTYAPPALPALPVLLGVGMGHALVQLRDMLAPLPKPAHSSPLFAVVDKESVLCAAAGLTNDATSGILSEMKDDPRILFIDDADPNAALARLTHWQSQRHGLPFLPLVNPFYQRMDNLLSGTDQPYYGFLRQQLEASRKFDFWSKARQPRFRTQSPRLLLITSRYFLMGEVAGACARMGIEHHTITLENDEMSSSDFITTLLKEVVEFHPDAVLTLNHLGVDREGILTDLLARLELPLASWFVDNPHLVLHLYEGLASPWLAIFTWDMDNIASLKEQGFTHVFHLPLGTDPDRFRPHPQSAPATWRSPVSFVGNSMIFKVGQRMQRTHFPAALLRGFKQVAHAFTLTTQRSVRDFVLDTPELAPAYSALPDTEARLGYETLLTWESTRQYRTDCVRRLLDVKSAPAPLIVGDSGWHIAFRHEQKPWRWHDALGYYDDLPRFYPLSDINFNTTSLQMKGAVNQRVFDVPAAGAFVLTDWRDQMDELFEPDTEIVCYHHPDEIPDLVRFYLAHPDARQRIATAGRQRVLACHTWDQRLRTLLDTMKSVYGI